MFTILDGLNRFLGFLNLNVKFKNKMYIILGAISTGYIGFLALKFFRYAAYARGIIYLLIFLVLLYFLVLNFFYYFTNKTVKWDISPFFEKYIQTDPTNERNEKHKQKKGGKYGEKVVIYDQRKEDLTQQQSFDVQLEEFDQQTIQELANFLVTHNLMDTSFEKRNQAHKKAKKGNTERIYEFEKGIDIPSYIVEKKQDKLLLSVGVNATERKEVAQVIKIGDLDSLKVMETYDVVATNARLFGGPYTQLGRSSSIKGVDDFTIQLEVICLVKESL